MAHLCLHSAFSLSCARKQQYSGCGSRAVLLRFAVHPPTARMPECQVGGSKMEIFQTDFSAPLTIHNDQASYVKHVLGPLYAFFTLFGCWRGGGLRRVPWRRMHDQATPFALTCKPSDGVSLHSGIIECGGPLSSFILILCEDKVQVAGATLCVSWALCVGVPSDSSLWPRVSWSTIVCTHARHFSHPLFIPKDTPARCLTPPVQEAVPSVRHLGQTARMHVH